jgi:hypothetical protein
MSDQRAFRNFAEFYPCHLNDHSDATCHRLHFIGSMQIQIVALSAVYSLMGDWGMFRDILIGRIRF